MSDATVHGRPDAGFDELAARVDRALEALEALDATSKARALEARAAIEAFHRLGLVTIVRTLKHDAA